MLTSEPRIACTLAPPNQGERVDFARAVAGEWLVHWVATDRGAELRFLSAAEDALHRLIRAESECCPFLDFDLRLKDSALSLTVEGPEEARPMILELFGLSS